MFSSITGSKIERYDKCQLAYFFSEQIHDQSIPMPGSHAEYRWFQTYTRRLFKQRHVGPLLKDVESLKGAELAMALKYHSPEAFGSAAAGWWRVYITGGKRKDKETGEMREFPPGTLEGGRPIEWLFHDQWYVAAARLNKNCANFYRFLMEEGPPVLTFSDEGGASFEREVAFEHKGGKHPARIKAIRRGHVIGEYGYWQKTQRELDEDWKVTLELLAYCTLAHEQEAYRLKWGVDPHRAAAWGGREMFIDTSVVYRHYNLQEGRVMETRRSDADLPEMLGRLEAAERAINGSRERRFFTPTPTRLKCSGCAYNVVDMRGHVVCDSRYPGVPVMKPIARLAEEDRMKRERRVAEGKPQKRSKKEPRPGRKKKPAQLEFRL